MASSLVATRGPRSGICNICGDHAKLTEDHTPPKGCIRIRAVQIQHIINHLSAEQPAGRGRISQNGVKYRTLCSRCNSAYLGASYDPAFIQFVNQITTYLTTCIKLPNIVETRVQPQKVMRSLIGHLSAQGVDRYKKGQYTESVRDYFLDTELPLPDHLRVFYWVYPYNHNIMARDCGFTDIRVGKPCAIWLLKFFPVAFLITFNQPQGLDFNLNELSTWRDQEISFETLDNVNLRNLPHEFWPEAPSDYSLVFYGQEAIVSNAYTTSRMKLKV